MNFKPIIIAVSLILSMLASSVASDSDIPWNNYKSGREIASRDRLPMMLYFWADPCPPCDKMKAETFRSPLVTDNIAPRIVPIKINLVNEFDLAERYRNYVTPAIIFLDPNGKVIETIIGFVDAETLAKHLDYIGGGYYRDMQFKEFLKISIKKDA